MVYPLRDKWFRRPARAHGDPASSRSGRIAQGVPGRQSTGSGRARSCGATAGASAAQPPSRGRRPAPSWRLPDSRQIRVEGVRQAFLRGICCLTVDRCPSRRASRLPRARVVDSQATEGSRQPRARLPVSFSVAAEASSVLAGLAGHEGRIAGSESCDRAGAESLNCKSETHSLTDGACAEPGRQPGRQGPAGRPGAAPPNRVA
jgi:hypothetical protein